MPIRGVASTRAGRLARGSRRRRRRGSSRSSAGLGAGDVEGGGDEAGAGRESGGRQRVEPPGRPLAGRRASAPGGGARRSGPSRIAPTPSSGSTARISTAAGPALGLGDHVQAVVHPVDKVHVGDARRPVHDRVPRGPPEAGMRGAVVLADVRLDLDDPADARAGPRGRRRGPGARRPARAPRRAWAARAAPAGAARDVRPAARLTRGAVPSGRRPVHPAGTGSRGRRGSPGSRCGEGCRR